MRYPLLTARSCGICKLVSIRFKLDVNRFPVLSVFVDKLGKVRYTFVADDIIVVPEVYTVETLLIV